MTARLFGWRVHLGLVGHDVLPDRRAALFTHAGDQFAIVFVRVPWRRA